MRQGGLYDTFEPKYPRVEVLLRFSRSICLAQVRNLARYALLDVSKVWDKRDKRPHENRAFPDCTVLSKDISKERAD